MRQDLLPKPDPHRKEATGKTDHPKSAGAAAGQPVFLQGVQAKRKESQPSDPLEQQADQVADAAVSARIPDATPARTPQSAVANGAPVPAADAGSPLQPPIRGRIEPVLGADLSDVRVHQSDSDRGIAGGLGARAFTHGRDIWMGPGESSSDLKLMAHEAAHVQQQGSGRAAPSIQKQPQTQPSGGSPAQLAGYVRNPQAETDAGLKTALSMLNAYRPTVDLANVEFRVMTAVPSYVGTGLTEDGRSIWEGNKPVIELTQEKYDTIDQHLQGTAKTGDVHAVIRTVGHELYHLFREKTGNQANPIQPVFKAEAEARMEKIRQNWIRFAQDPGGARELGIPKGRQVTKWEDIPAAERKKIEEGATQTSEIQGLYERTAYLVEEIYVKTEELSFLRVQQRAETGPDHPSLASISLQAQLIYRLSTALDQSVGQDFMTADLLAKTRTAMLDFLRKRYPHKGNSSVDSYEVIFYLTAKDSGLPPLYDDNGALISAKPPEARVP